MDMELQDYLSNDFKVYVDVNVDHFSDGRVLPRSFIWEDGNRYDIDRVVDICRAVSLKAGGSGLRFTVQVGGKKTFMFLEEDHGIDRWFMERK